MMRWPILNVSMCTTAEYPLTWNTRCSPNIIVRMKIGVLIIQNLRDHTVDLYMTQSIIVRRGNMRTFSFDK